MAKVTKKKTTTKKKVLELESEAALPEPSPRRISFSWPVRCPRCGTFNNHRVTSRLSIQYRKCDHPTCRFSFKVIGKEV